MIRKVVVSTFLVLCALPAMCQDAERGSGTVPIYRVTVVQRNVEAINYQYRTGPTKIDFHGTVLMPKAKGEATVESRRGRTEVEASVDNVEESQRFGREYLTYVLWAITPEGRPHNLGEIVPGSSNKARLRVTTDLQAFGLIVTAEPYSAVRQPSDVVVLENRVRSDTVGTVQQIHARYELMPRGQYTWLGSQSNTANAPKVSMDQYDALSQLYQAQNAIGIARSVNAEQYAPNTLAKAQQLANEAHRLQLLSKGNTSLVVQNAREAAQTAEDARVITERRRQEEKLSQAQAEVSVARQAKAQADADAQRAQIDADAARAQAEAERAARQRAEGEAAAARQSAAQAQAAAESSRAQAAQVVLDQSSRQRREQEIRQKTELRMRLLEQLNGVLAARDTPRGLVVTLPDANFSGPVLRGMVANHVARVAMIVAQPGLRAEVEGHTDSASTETLSWRRAEAVRGILVGSGLSGSSVTARGLGNTRPLYSNASVSGRMENRRVEIVISGDPIGNLPFWDRAYTLSMR